MRRAADHLSSENGGTSDAKSADEQMMLPLINNNESADEMENTTTTITKKKQQHDDESQQQQKSRPSSEQQLANATTTTQKIDSHHQPKRPPGGGGNDVLYKARSLSSGAVLPLFTDKVRNNVRSRGILIGVYAVSTAFVCLLLVYAFSISSNPQWQARFATKPPSTIYLGEPLSTFSFEVLDSDTGRGVGGLGVFAFLSPLTEVDLTVTLDQGTTVSRTLQCIRDLTLLSSTTYADDVAFCDPSTYGMVRQSFAVTNARGLAEFNNLTLGFGVLGSYILTIGLASNPDVYVTQFMTVTSNVQAIQIDQSINATMYYDGEARFYVPVIDLTAEEVEWHGQDVVITVSFVPSARFTAYYFLDDATAVAEQTANYLNIPVSDYLASIAHDIEPLVPYVCGAIIALDLQKNGEGSINSIIQPLSGPSRKGQQFVNNIACNTSVSAGNLTLTGDGYQRVFSVTLVFHNFAVTSSNSAEMFFGASVMGVIIPLPVRNLGTPTQVPAQLIVAATPFSNVSSVVVSCAACTAEDGMWMVAEQTEIRNRTLVATVLGGTNLSTPQVNRVVYLYARASNTNNSVVLGSLASTAPTISPKSLLFETAFTDETGVAQLRSAQFSTSGAPGVYDLYAVCDGVIATWPSGRTTQQITVTSKVADVQYIFNGDATQVEYVGEPWEVLPVFLVSGSSGIGIPGKTVTLTTSTARGFFGGVADGPVGLTSASLQTNDDGLSLMSSMTVHSLSEPSWTAGGRAPQPVEFNITVDGTVYGTFTRWIAPPRNFSWVVPPPPAQEEEERKEVRRSVGAQVEHYDTDSDRPRRFTTQQAEIAHLVDWEDEHNLRAIEPLSSPPSRPQLSIRRLKQRKHGQTWGRRPPSPPLRRHYDVPQAVSLANNASSPSPHGSCQFIHVIDLPLQGYFGIPFYLVILAVDALGHAVPNASVTLTVDPAYIPPLPGQKIYTEQFTAEPDGSFIAAVGLSGMPLEFSIAGSMFCTDAPTAVNHVVMNFVSRITNAEIVKIGSNTLCARLGVRRDPSPSSSSLLISPSHPVYVTVVPRWYPAYVVNFLTPELFPKAITTVLTNASEAENVCVSMSNSSVVTFPSGLYGFLISTDGNFQAPLVLTTLLVNDTIVLEVNRSMFQSAVDTSIRVGNIFPSEPIVRATYGSTGLPITNITVFIQFALVIDNERQYQDIYSDPRDLVMGGFAVLNLSSSENPIQKPIGTPTDAEGYSFFSGIRLAGAPPAIPISARYCVNIDVHTSLTFTDPTTSVCVDDPFVGVLPISQTVSFSTSVKTLSGSPSQPLPPITITAQLNDGGTPPGIMCAPVLLNVPETYLVFASNIFTAFAAYGTFRTLGNVLTIVNGITLSSLMPEGNYVLQFVCSGGITLPMPLVVSSTPASIVLAIPPPPLSKPVVTSRIVILSTQLLSQSATPVAFRDMELSVQSLTPVQNCSGKTCGYLDAASILYATTDVNGAAIFTLVFTAGNSSDFILNFKVADSLSAIAVKQGSRGQLQSMANLFGLPTSILLPTLVSRIPDLKTLLSVASSTAGIGTQQSGSLIPGGGAAPLDTPTAAGGGSSHAGSGSNSGGGGGGGAYTNPLASLVGLFRAALQEASGGAFSGSSFSAPVTLQSSIRLYNSVSDGHFVRRVVIGNIQLPRPVEEVVAISGLSINTAVSVQLDNTSSPIVQFFNDDGTPAANRSVIVEVLPINTNDCTVTYRAVDFVTDANGMLVLSPLTITASTPGTYQLQVSAEGGGAIQTNVFTVSQIPPLSRTEYMKYLAIFLVCFFSPMLMASVPHSRRGYLPVACLVVVGAMVATWVLRDFVPTNQPLYRAYFYFLASITSAVAVATLAMAVIDLLAYDVLGKHRFRLFNDERRAEDILRYSTWITNVRIRHQAALWTAQQQKRSSSVAARLKSIKYEKMRAAIGSVNQFAGTELVDDSRIAVKQANRRRRVLQQSLMYGPSESFDAVYPPINFLIVVGISAVLLVTLCFIIVYMYDFALRKINLFVSYLPDTNGSEGVQLELINKLLILAITTTIDIIVRMFPNFSQLASVNNAVQNIDLVQALGVVREYLSEGLLRLQIAFWVAGSISCVVFIGTIAMTWATIPNTIRQIRRGKQSVPSAVGPTEAYIGMHCLQLILMHQLVFWPLTIIVFLLSVSGIRVFLWDKLSVIIVASIVSFVTQTLVVKLLVSRFLSDGKWMVIRPELYSIWHFAGLILGVFSGLIKSAVRWGMSLGLVSALFARLDQAIFPQLFASMDKGHTGFLSVVAIEAKTGNPIFIMFNTLLLVEAKLRSEGEAASSRAASLSGAGGKLASDTPAIYRNPTSSRNDDAAPEGFLLVDDRLFATDFNLSSVVKNVARLLLRREAGCSVQLREPPTIVPKSCGHHAVQQGSSAASSATIDLTPFLNRAERARRGRIRQRFWLYTILTANPALVPHRKHNLSALLDDEVVDAREDQHSGVCEVNVSVVV